MRLLFLLCCPSTKAMRVPTGINGEKPFSFSQLKEIAFFLNQKIHVCYRQKSVPKWPKRDGTT